MGSWGIAMRQSDYGLDLLGAIVSDPTYHSGPPPAERDRWEVPDSKDHLL